MLRSAVDIVQIRDDGLHEERSVVADTAVAPCEECGRELLTIIFDQDGDTLVVEIHVDEITWLPDCGGGLQ